MNEKVVYNPLAIGSDGGMGFGGNGLMGLLLAGLLFGNRRGGLFGGDGGSGAEVLAGDIASKVVELQTTADIKEEVAASQAALTALIEGAKLDAVKSGLEAKIAALQSTNEITNKIGNVETEIQAVKCNIDGKIAASTQAILNQLNADKLDSKNDEISSLRAAKSQLEQNSVFSNQFQAINSVLVNLANQTQHLTNSVVNFGNGNNTGQSATNNIVKN